MTTPEENAPKTEDTDQVEPGKEREPRSDARTELGAELEDKMAEKGLSRDDFTGS
ncbi:hypothetical protein ACQEU6_04235 [Spirillospora sp. CA-108201]